MPKGVATALIRAEYSGAGLASLADSTLALPVLLPATASAVVAPAVASSEDGCACNPPPPPADAAGEEDEDTGTAGGETATIAGAATVAETTPVAA